LRAFSSVGGSPGRCFLNTSISAESSLVAMSFSSVLTMKIELLNSFRIASLDDVSIWKPVVGSSAGSARRRVVIGSFRLRSMRA